MVSESGLCHGGLEIDKKTGDAIRHSLRSGLVSKRGVAQSIGLSPRSLDRELARCGTSYRAILDTVRRELAERKLVESRRSLAEVSQILGYADPANFTRAFRRWTGESPRSFRRRWREMTRREAPKSGE